MIRYHRNKPGVFTLPSAAGRKTRKSALKHPIQYGRATINLTDEGLEQYTVVCWLRAHNIRFIHVPNEARRHGLEMLMLHALGAVPGASDLLIFDHPPEKPEYCGVAIEMKSKTGKETENQTDFRLMLQDCGWYTACCKGADEAIRLLVALGYGRRPDNAA